VAEATDLWRELRDRLDEGSHLTILAPNCTVARKEIDRRLEIDMVVLAAGDFGRRGLDLIKWIKGSPRYRQIPLLMAGTSFDEVALAAYIEMGVNDIILLPVQKATLDAKLAKALSSGRKTVLVVDDEAVIVDVLKEFLELERFRVLTAASAEEAVTVLGANQVDVIVSDIMLPGMSGTDLLVKVKQERKDLPIILITGCSQNTGPQQAMEAGADGYFAKPFHNKELALTLRRVLLAAERGPRRESVSTG
jgi:DNA-binding response OmpR family regulator